MTIASIVREFSFIRFADVDLSLPENQRRNLFPSVTVGCSQDECAFDHLGRDYEALHSEVGGKSMESLSSLSPISKRTPLITLLCGRMHAWFDFPL